METTDVKPAVAAPSAAEPVNPFASGKLTKEISKAWTDGEEVKPKPAAPAAADAQKVAHSEEKSESAPVTEPGNKQESSRRKPAAEQRIAQLSSESKGKDAEIERLRRELATKADGKIAEPSTAKPAEQPKALEPPKRPESKDFADWEKYEAAKEDYFEKLADYKAQKAIQDDRQRQTVEAGQKRLNEQIAEAKTRYPDFDDVIKPVLQQIGPTLKDGQVVHQIHPLVAETINRSPLLQDVLYVLGSDAKGLEDFVRTAQTDPIEAQRKVWVLEQVIADELKTKSTTAPAEKKDPPPAKTKTDEPQPTKEVGNRGTGPDDPAADAVRRANGKLTKEVSAAWARKAAERFSR